MSDAARKIQIIKGKAGSQTEGMVFITNREEETAARDLIAAAGAVKAGGKGDLALWRLPRDMNEAAIEALRSAAEAAEAGDAAPIPESEPDGSTSCVSSEAGRDAADLGHGYRLGMSIAQRDSCRVPVVPGSVREGDVIEVDGVSREIVMLSPVLHVGGDLIENFRSRFPSFQPGRDLEYQFAMWPYDPENVPASQPEDPEP